MLLPVVAGGAAAAALLLLRSRAGAERRRRAGTRPASRHGARPVLALDLDEVLGGFVPALCKWHNRVYGSRFAPRDFFSYTFADVWGGSPSEGQAKVFAFFQSPEFLALEPLAGAQEAVARLSRRFDVHVVTSRQLEIEAETLAWLSRHFEGVISQRNVHFGNHWSRLSPDPDAQCASKKSKADMCAAISAVALVDDSPRYCREVSGALGIATLLFGDYAWNADDSPLHARIVRCRDWRAVEAKLAELGLGELL
jgi:5'(3')-deoxyribonucleotidase